MKLFLVTALLGLTSINAFATIGVYTCTLQGGKEQATLVYESSSHAVDWMPDDGLKTTKSNTKGRVLNSGEVEATLFGFQDQSDEIILPAIADQSPKQMTIYTYHNDDDQAEDVQNFDCKQ